MLRIDETGVLSDPADASTLGEIALKDRTRVCVPAVPYRTPELLFDKLNEFLHSGRQDVMIVIPPGVGGDGSLTLPSPGGRGVGCSQNKNGFTFWKDFARVGAAEA